MTCSWEELTGVECKTPAAEAVPIGQSKRLPLCPQHASEYRQDMAERGERK